MNASLSQVNPNSVVYDPTDFTPNDWSNIITISAAAMSSVLLVLFKSRCTEINLCFGFWKCLRDPFGDDEEDKKKEEEKKKKEEKEQLTKPVAAANMERELNPPLLPRTDSVVQEVVLEPEPEPQASITGISAPTGLKDAENLLPKV